MTGNFKFSLISDMHVDFSQPKTPYDKLEKVVVVAGDTSNGLLGLKFLNKIKNKGHDLFSIDGNHEHYSNRKQGRTETTTRNDFYTGLGQHMVEHFDGVSIIGANGWYFVEDEELWANYMNDSYNGQISGEDVNVFARRDADFIRHHISQSPTPVVIVTHTAPCLDTLNPYYSGHYSNEWYWNPLMEDVLKEFSDKILVWCHGHTHAPSDKIVHGVRVACNPRGYPGENPHWAPQTIEVSW